MQGYFWNTIVAVNSILWFASLTFLTYAFGMLLVRLQWKQFLLALTIFIAVSLVEIVLAALAHDK